MKKDFKKFKRNGGAAMLISVVFFLFISLAIISGMVGPTVREFKNASVNLNSKRSYFLAESGVEDAFYRIKTGLTIGTSENITIDSNIATTVIDTAGSNKEITSLGDVSNYERRVAMTLIVGEGLSFHYGMQIGEGGLDMSNSSAINGNVYVNGNITGTNNPQITGAAIATGTISGMTIGQSGAGNAWAHTVNNSTVAGNLYCQTGSGNNKDPCDTSQGDPASLDFPISDAQIQSWKDEAVAGGEPLPGGINLSNGETLAIGPKKIEGNLNLSGDAILTVSGTLWVTGNISLANTSQIKLSSSYGGASGIIVAGGTISTANSASFAGSGATGSYIMMLTTSTAAGAIDIQNHAGAVILVAPYGKINFANSAGAKEAIAKTIGMSNSSTLIYESGLVNVNFTSGPSGGYNISSWKETE